MVSKAGSGSFWCGDGCVQHWGSARQLLNISPGAGGPVLDLPGKELRMHVEEAVVRTARVFAKCALQGTLLLLIAGTSSSMSGYLPLTNRHLFVGWLHLRVQGYQQLKVMRNGRQVSCFAEFDTVENAVMCHTTQQVCAWLQQCRVFGDMPWV